MDREDWCRLLDFANLYAELNSTCTKTAVGCVLFKEGLAFSYGANQGEIDCRKFGCLRIATFGNNSKEHRNVCRCTHSEINAIKRANGSTKGTTAVVTRYPCDDCAKALVGAGIKKVVYGREFEISDWAKKLFADNGVEVIHIPEWNCDKADTNN